MNKAIFLVAFLFGYTMQAITGFAGNIFCMPIGTHMLGLHESISVLNAMGFFACGLLGLLNIKFVNWRELGKIIAIMLPFVLVGIWLDSVLSLDVLLKIYGAVIIFVGLKNLLQKRQRFLPEWALVLVVIGAGLIQGMFVSGGALLVIYAIQKLPDKRQFRATLSMVWGILNFIYAVIAFQQGHFTGDVVQVIVLCIPLALLATFLGSKLQAHISQKHFLTLTYVLLLAIGVVLLVTS